MIQQAEQRRQNVKAQIRLLKKELDQYESELIEATLIKENAMEQLERATNAILPIRSTEREVEIELFQSRHPELCQMALERDLVKKD